jgi:hypothetical protein
MTDVAAKLFKDLGPLCSSVMLRSVMLSACGKYRYMLSRTWSQGPHLGWIMLNPSTADASIDDPTIRRCIGFSRDAGYCGMHVCNLFALRATDPRELLAATDPIGPKNDEAIASLAMSTRKMVLAWGSHKLCSDRVERVLGLLRNVDVDLVCLGLTKDGHPRHPVRLNRRTSFVAYGPKKAQVPS